MAQKQYPILNNFSRGELSSRMEGRTDIPGYYNGCKIMRNAIMVAQGGVEKRPGTIFLDEVYDDSDNVRLIPFEISDEHLYQVEVGKHYLRIWDAREKAVIEVKPGETIIHTPYSGEAINELQTAFNEGVLYFAHMDFPIKVLRFVKTINGSTGAEEISFNWEEPTTKVYPYDGAKEYNFGDYVSHSGSYFKSLITQKGTTPAASTWSNGTEVLQATPSGDISVYAGGTFTAGDIYYYDGAIHKALKDYSGGDPCNPGTGVIVLTDTDDEAQWEWVWFWETKCVDHNWLGVCSKRETIQEYLNRKYASSNTTVVVENSTANRRLAPIGLGTVSIHVKFHLHHRNKPFYSEDGPPEEHYWEKIGGIPDNADTSISTVYQWISGNTYNPGDVVWSTDYRVYECLATTSTTTAPSSDPVWELLDGNPFFSADGDYPAAISFMEGRLWLAGTKNRPQTIFASKIGRYLDFNTGTDDDDSFYFTIAAEKSSRIKWIMARDNLMIGTSSSEWLATGNGAPMTPTNISIMRQSAYGSAYQQAVYVADTLLFFQKGGAKLREYIYSNDNKAYLANDLTFFADHITVSGIKASTYQQNPDSILWNVKNDGTLIGLTYDRLNGIFGWHNHDTLGSFQDVSTIDGENDEDEVWFIVRRNTSSGYKQYIEIMSSRNSRNRQALVFSDSSYIFTAGDMFSADSIDLDTNHIKVTYSGSSTVSNGDIIKIFNTDSLLDNTVFEISDATGTDFLLKDLNGDYIEYDSFDSTSGSFTIVSNIVTGLDHLLGQTVQVLADGAALPSVLVVDDVAGTGEVGIEIQSYANQVVCGLEYTMMIEPESIELQGYSTMGAKKRISQVTLRLFETLGGYVGSDIEHLQELRFRSTDIPFGTPPPLFTGSINIPVDSSSERESSIIITHNQPLPMTILAIISDITYSRS